MMLRKVLLTITIFFPTTSPVFQATVAIVILFTFLVLQVKYQPYLKRASHPVSLHSSKKNKDGGVVGLFGSLIGSQNNDSSGEEKQRLLKKGAWDDVHDNDLAKKRWKRAILVTRTEIRWHHILHTHTKDAAALLFDYNSLELMALSCAIMVLLNGIMLETNSLRAPVLGLLQIAPQELTQGFVRFIDVLTVVMFLIPCSLLPLSIIVDVWRNIAFAIHNREMEKKKREVAIMSARADAASKNREQSKVEKWRFVQKAKLERDLSIVDKDHASVMKASKIAYEEDRLDLEEDLKRLLTARVRYTELQAMLRSKTPADALEAQKLTMDLSKITAARSAMDDRLLELQDEMSLLDQEYRNKSSKRQASFAQKRAGMNLAFQEALRNKIESGDKKAHDTALSGNMPVQLQMKVLVSQRHFDDKMKSMVLVKEQMSQLQKRLGSDAAGELAERANLDKELVEMDNQLADHHDDLHDVKQDKLDALESQKQNLFGQQKGHSQKMHQIDMAAEAHRRALEKELGPEQYAAYMMAVEQSRKRKDKAHQDEITVRSSAKADGLSEAEIEARVRAIRHAAEADCAAYMSTVDATKRDKHAKLVARLAKIKAKEAAEIQEINQDANGGGASTDDLEDRVREIQAKAKAEVDAAMQASGAQVDEKHARLIKRLEKMKRKQVKAEAMARMKASLDGESPEGTVNAVNEVREAAKAEEEQLVTELMTDEAKDVMQTLRDVAVLKAEQGEQIYNLLKSQQGGDSSSSKKMTQEELGDQVKRIKEESNENIMDMLTSVGIEVGKKIQKLLEKIAARKAKEISRVEQLQVKRQKTTDANTIASIDAKIQVEAAEAESDIEDCITAIANRVNSKGDKSKKRLTKLLDLAVAHDKAQVEMDEMEQKRKMLEQRASDIQADADEASRGVAARTAIAKEEAQEKLNKRLEGKRRKRAKALQHNAHAKKQLEKEAKRMDEYQSKKEKLNSLEDEVAKINAEFNDHVEAQIHAMENEKERQHQSVAARRARAKERRRAGGGGGGSGSGSSRGGGSGSSGGGGGSSASLRLARSEMNETLTKAKQRKMQGKSAEEQLEALLADIQMNLAHQNDFDGGGGPGTIRKPRLNLATPHANLGAGSKEALAEARDLLKGRLAGQKVSRDGALTVLQSRAAGGKSGNLRPPDLM